MEGSGATYDVHVRFIGKRIVNFLLVLTFSPGVTAEAPQAKIDRISAGVSVSAEFYRRIGRPPPIIFARIDEPVNALQLCC